MMYRQFRSHFPSACLLADIARAAACWTKTSATRVVLLAVVSVFLFGAPVGCQRAEQQLESASPPSVTPPPAGLNENPGEPDMVRPENLPEGR